MYTQIRHYVDISKSLLRVPTYLLLCMYLVVGLLAGVFFSDGSIGLADALPLAGCVVIIALWYMNGTALNDFADYEIDLINLKGDRDRPLVMGVANRNELSNLATAYAVSALGVAIFISEWHFAITAVLLLLNFAYSIRPFQISRRGGLAPLLLPLGYIALPYLLGFGIETTTIPKLGYVLLLALYLQFLGRIILKDYRDVKGDSAHGKQTFLLKYGNSIVCLVSGLSITTSGAIMLTIFEFGMLLFPLLVLTSYALTILYKLSTTEKWKQQKPLLASFGRSMTGVTSTLIIVLGSLIWHFSQAELAILSFGLAFIYLASSQQAFRFNTEQLVTKHSHR